MSVIIFALMPLAAIAGGPAASDDLIGLNNTAEQMKRIDFNPEALEIDGDLAGFQLTRSTGQPEEGLYIVTLTIKSMEAARPPKFSVRWNTPSVDITGFWTPKITLNKANYYDSNVTSRAARFAPVVCLLNSADLNRLTIACSDGLRQIEVRSDLIEEDANFHNSVTFFSERSPAVTDYSVQVRVDTRSVPFWQALKEVSDWWAGQEGYKPSYVPDAARQPMYSTWYSFHQSITADEVVEQCRLSKELGLHAVIVDDGWQTLDSRRGYAFTGDWLPERIPDMKSFVDRVHALGMKFLLWYSLPLVGKNSANYERFKGKYLWHWDSQGASVLDPRFPEVREFIIGIYEKALREWDLDGFKLDFIGMFRPEENTAFEATEGRDMASLDEAVDRLMTDIMARLRAIRPDIMIEFRQPYIGPLMRKYGNMFRGTDCPNMALVNRVETTDVRLLCGSTAAHSDMFMWHADDTVETAALQILNVLFAVPQLSVRLDRIPPEHLEMIKFWIGYWNENREVLLAGEFKPQNPSANYPLLAAEKGDKKIFAVYNDIVVDLGGGAFKSIDIVNAKSSHFVVVKLDEDIGQVSVKAFDCRGRLISESKQPLHSGVHKMEVPVSGLLVIDRK
jgi:alpha-galactosidase